MSIGTHTGTGTQGPLWGHLWGYGVPYGDKAIRSPMGTSGRSGETYRALGPLWGQLWGWGRRHLQGDVHEDVAIGGHP